MKRIALAASIAALLFVACGDDDDQQCPTCTTGGGAGGSGGETTTGGGGDGGETTTGGGGGTGGSVPMRADGEHCLTDEQCENGFCLGEEITGWPQGYCSQVCNGLIECDSPDSSCIGIGVGDFCLANCDPAGDDCASAQACIELSEELAVCGMGCEVDNDCPTMGNCDSDSGLCFCSEDAGCPTLGNCEANGACYEPEICDNGEDEDADGLYDCEDDDCVADNGCTATIDAACNGAGALSSPQDGDTTGGTASFAGSCTGSMGALEELWAFTPSQDALLQIELDSATDQGIYVRSDCGDPATELGCTDAVYGGEIEQLYVQAQSGSAVTIFVDGYLTPDEAGPYTLTVTENPMMSESEANDDFGTANPWTAGSAIAAEINPADESDWFAITLSGGGNGHYINARIIAGSADQCGPNGPIDSEIEILGTDGSTQLAFNDDAGFFDYCSDTSATGLTQGTYYVRTSPSVAYCSGCSYTYTMVIDAQ